MNDLGILLAGMAVERMRERVRGAVADRPAAHDRARERHHRGGSRFGFGRRRRTTAPTITPRPA